MNINISENEDTVFAVFDGDVDLMGIKELKEVLFNAVKTNDKNLEVDLRHANYLDSSGIGMFLTLNKMLRDKGKKLKLVNIPDVIQKIFELSSADGLFKS